MVKANFSDAIRRIVAAEMAPLRARLAKLESMLEHAPEAKGQFIDMKAIRATYPVGRSSIQADVAKGILKAKKTAGATSAGKLVFDRDDVDRWFRDRFPDREDPKGA